MQETEKVIVEMEIRVVVELPEAKRGEVVTCDGCGVPLLSVRERAIESVVCAFPEEIEIYIDGKDSEPATVTFNVSGVNVMDVMVE